MKRARDIRDQLLGLMDRCEIELLSNPQDIGAAGGGWLGVAAAACGGARLPRRRRPLSTALLPSPNPLLRPQRPSARQ